MADYKYIIKDGQRFRTTTTVKQTSEIEGLNELIRDLADFADNAMPDLFKTSDVAARVVLKRSKELAPVDTSDPFHAGTLKRSLKVVKPKTKKGVYIAISRVTFGKDAAYAVPVELGHDVRLTKGGQAVGHVKEHPFLRPAADEKKPEVIDIMIRSMNEILDRELKG
jgi:HK97 gp10 family phage protein